MAGLDAASMATGVLGAGINLFNGIMNRKQQQKINDQQVAIDQRNFDYTVAQNQLTRDREDTAHQREVADLQAAGLSPLAAMGGASSAPLSGYSGSPNIAPLRYGDGSAQMIANMAEGMRDIWKVKNVNKQNDLARNHEENMENLKHLNKMEELLTQIESNEKNAQLSADTQLQTASISSQTSKDVAKMNNEQSEANSIRQQITAYKNIQANVDIANRKLNVEQIENCKKSFRDMGVVHFQEHNDPLTVTQHNREVMARFRNWQDKNLDKLGSYSSSSGGSAGVFGVGNLGANSSKSTNQSEKYYESAKGFWSDPDNTIWICNGSGKSKRVDFSTSKAKGSSSARTKG